MFCRGRVRRLGGGGGCRRVGVRPRVGRGRGWGGTMAGFGLVRWWAGKWVAGWVVWSFWGPLGAVFWVCGVGLFLGSCDTL